MKRYQLQTSDGVRIVWAQSGQAAQDKVAATGLTVYRVEEKPFRFFGESRGRDGSKKVNEYQNGVRI